MAPRPNFAINSRAARFAQKGQAYSATARRKNNQRFS